MESRWKISIAVFLGILIAGWLLYSTIDEVRFVKVEDRAGDYQWVDTNKNNIVDFSDENEFEKSSEGNYKRETFHQVWNELNITVTFVFFLFMAVLMMGVRDLGYMMRIRTLTDNQLSWRQSFRVIMIWEFASAITPGIVGGAAVAMFILRKEGINLGKSTAIVLITALLDELFYIFIVPITIFIVGWEVLFPVGINNSFIGMPVEPLTLFMIAFGFIFFLVAFLLIAIFIAPFWFKRILVFICRIPLLRRLKPKAEKVGDDIIEASKEFKGKSVNFWLKAFGATVFSWMGRFMVINFLILAFAPFADQLLVFARQLTMWVVLLISPTPGGSGIAEFAFSGFLKDFIPFGMVAVMAILWRLISYYPYLFMGAILIPRWMRNNP